MPEGRIYIRDVERKLSFSNVSEPLGFIVGDIVDNGWTDNDVEVVVTKDQPPRELDELGKEINPEIEQTIHDMINNITEKRIKFTYSKTFTGKKSCIPIFANSQSPMRSKEVCQKPSKSKTVSLSKPLIINTTVSSDHPTEEEKLSETKQEEHKLPAMTRSELQFYKEVEKSFDVMEKDIINKILKKKYAEADKGMLKVKVDDVALQSAIATGMIDRAEKGLRIAYGQVGKSIPEQAIFPSLRKVIDNYSVKLAGNISKDIQSNVTKEIAMGINNHRSPSDIANGWKIRNEAGEVIKESSGIKGLFKKDMVIKVPAKKGSTGNIIRRAYERRLTPKQRATMIARTETLRAQNNGYIEGLRANSDIVKGWEWHTQGDSKVSTECAAKEGNVYSLNVDWEPTHVNCRCYATDVMKKKLSKHSHSLDTTENKTYKFNMHRVWDNYTYQLDFSYETDSGINGWEVNDCLANSQAIKPNTTKEAIMAERLNISKIDWKLGQFKQTTISKKGKLIKAQLRVKRKSKQYPTELFNKNGKLGNKIYALLDKGDIEYGTVRDNSIEMFIAGRKLKGRIILRKAFVNGKMFWSLLQPNDSTPYLLSRKAKQESYVPPVGKSALPKAIRDSIPNSLAWWKKSLQGDEAREAIDQIMLLRKKNKLTNSYFKFNKDAGKYTLSVDIGKASYYDFVLKSNPMFNNETVCEKVIVKNKSQFDNSDSVVEGCVDIIEDNDNFTCMKFSDTALEGHWVFDCKNTLARIGTFKRTTMPRSNNLVDDLKKLSSEIKNKRDDAGSSIIGRINEYLGTDRHYRHSMAIPRPYYLSAWPSNAKFKMPLIIEGIALEEGTWTGAGQESVRYYKEVLKDAAHLFKGVQLKVNHNDVDQEAVVGWVTDSWYVFSDGKGKIMYKAMVFNHQIAKMVYEKKLKAVSVGVWVREKKANDGVNDAVKINKADELSLVEHPGCETATAKVSN